MPSPVMYTVINVHHNKTTFTNNLGNIPLCLCVAPSLVNVSTVVIPVIILSFLDVPMKMLYVPSS